MHQVRGIQLKERKYPDKIHLCSQELLISVYTNRPADLQADMQITRRRVKSKLDACGWTTV
jgi:hypothetical protein